MYNFESCVKIGIVRIEELPYHVNRNLRILYVLSGSIELSWVSGKQILSKNEIEIVNVNEPVSVKKYTDENVVAIYEIDMEFAKKYCEDIEAVTYNCNCDFFFPSKAKIEDQNYLKEKLIQTYRIYSNQNTHYKLPAEAMEIIIAIKDKFNDIKNIFSDNTKSDVHAERFLRINHYLIDNINRKISLKEIAANEYLSPYYVSKEFNERLNKSFYTIVDYYRVKKSVNLLISTDKAITTISEECGFSANRYFYDKFRIYMGCTPIQFRKELRRKIPHGKKIAIDSAETAEYFDNADNALNLMNIHITDIYISKNISKSEAYDFMDEKIRALEHKKNLFFQKEGASELFKREKKVEIIKPFDFTYRFINDEKFFQWADSELIKGKTTLHPSCLRILEFITEEKGQIIYKCKHSVIRQNDSGIITGIFLNGSDADERYVIHLEDMFAGGAVVKEEVSRISFEEFENIRRTSDKLAYSLCRPAASLFKIERKSMTYEATIKKGDILLLSLLPHRITDFKI